MLRAGPALLTVVRRRRTKTRCGASVRGTPTRHFWPLMRIAFRATEGGFQVDGYALVCGVIGIDADGAEHYLKFQRPPEGTAADEDWGVYIEYDDQINGEFGRIRECRLSRDLLSVDLSRQLGTLVGVDGFDIVMAIDDVSYEQVRTGLPRIFRDDSGLLLTA
jgi:hypothetical protein